MTAQTRTLPSKVVEFSANNPKFEKLDRGWIYRELYLHLTGEVDISSGGNAGDAPLSPEAIVQRLRLRKNTTNDVYSLDFHAMTQLMRVFFDTTKDVGYKTIDPSATGKQEFEVYLVVPLWHPHVAKPIEWALDALNLNDLHIEVQWGDLADLVGPNATATFSKEPQLEIGKYVHTGGAVPPHRGWRVTNMVSEEITAAAANRRFDLDPGEMMRGFLIRTMSGDPAKPARDVLNHLELTTGNETFFEVNEAQLAYTSQIRKDQGGIEAGYYFFDLLGDGYATEALDTRGFRELYFRADVNAPTNAKVDIYPLELLPNRQQGNG